MARRIRVAPEAEAYINEIHVWYERARAGLGEQVAIALGQTLLEVSRHPAAGHEWLGGVGTAGALIATVVLLRKELRAHERREQKDVADQASKVAGWLDPTADHSAGAVVIVVNGSTLPIYSCGVSIEFPGEDYSGAYVPGLVPPESRSVGVVAVPESAKGRRPRMIASNQFPITLSFVDSYGYQWRRDPDGVLRPFLPELSRRDRRRLKGSRLKGSRSRDQS